MAKQPSSWTETSPQYVPVTGMHKIWRSLRRSLGSIGAVRSTYGLFCALRDRCIWGSDERVNTSLLNLYAEHLDPWHYTGLDEQARFANAVELLDRVRGDSRFREVLEVGCAEGHFTAQLVLRCESLISVDISQVAMDRAKERCPDSSVQFRILDLRQDPLPGPFDLIVVMDVLEYFFRPELIRRLRPKLVLALKPCGYLLVGNSRQSRLFEDVWWGKYLIRGGKQIGAFIGSDPNLEVVSESSNDMFVNTLFRKV
jgi:SAM-dependent methyltransferase